MSKTKKGSFNYNFIKSLIIILPVLNEIKFTSMHSKLNSTKSVIKTDNINL